MVRSLALGLPAGTRLDPHHHAWPQLVYGTDGAMAVESEEGAWVVPPQRAVWIPRGVEHVIETLGEVRMRTLYIHPSYGPLVPDSPAVLHITPLLRELIVLIVERGSLDRRNRREARLASVLMDQLASASAVPLALALPRDPRARRVAERVRAEPGSRRSLAELAQGCGATPRTIERLFQREVSLSFGRWRRHARLLEAHRLLAEGLPVTVVAHRVGYESASAFIAMFKRALGKTPGRFYSLS